MHYSIIRLQHPDNNRSNYFDIERRGHIVAHQLEMRVIKRMKDVVFGAGKGNVETEGVVAFVQQALAKARAKETGTAGNQNS